VFEALWSARAAEVDAVIDAKGLKQMNDSGALEKIIDEVIAANPDNVAQFRAGKDKAFNALVGQVMKASKGKANPRRSMSCCAAWMMAMDSRAAVPADITSSTISTRPFSGAPTRVPPSPWSLASLRL
jgi:Glu-tRNA(Gln) amidotransferase subunit E-like FAD-binding protein